MTLRLAPSAHALRIVALLVGCAVAGQARPAFADEGRINRKVAVLLLLKVLTYDKTFAARGDGDFVVLLAAEPGQKSDREALLAEIERSGPQTILSRPLRFVRAEADGRALEDAIRATRASALLVLPGISRDKAAELAGVGTRLRVYTLGLDEAVVAAGVALGVAIEDGRPQILINHPATEAIGAEFEPALLQRARVIQ